MELRSVIEYLTQQRTALDETIVCLERLSKGTPAGQIPLAPRKRGRKFMAEADRQKVSQRMKEYWAARRSQKTFSAGSH